MSVIVDEDTKVVVQGITGYQGTYHSQAMAEFGTSIVAGVTPGKGGQEVHGVPVFDTVHEAVERTGANASCVFVPAPFTKSAVLEAIDAGIGTIVTVTEHVPVHDAIEFVAVAKARRVTLIGPNCPGLGSPGTAKIGILPNKIFRKGDVGVVSRSGTLTSPFLNILLGRMPTFPRTWLPAIRPTACCPDRARSACPRRSSATRPWRCPGCCGSTSAGPASSRTSPRGTGSR